jgi:hypothetical protein
MFIEEYEYDPEWEEEKKKINKNLLKQMEKGVSLIALGYFSEAMMWYDENCLKELGLETEVIYNTNFHVTPINRRVYLELGGTFYLVARKE